MEEERAEQSRSMKDRVAETKAQEQRERDRARRVEQEEEWRCVEKLAQVRDVRGYIPFPREPR